MSPSTVLQRQRLALLSRQRKSTRDPALRRQLVHRRVLGRRTIASSLSPISGFLPVRIFQAQQRVLDERFSFISPSPIICCIAGLTQDNNSVTSSIDSLSGIGGYMSTRNPTRILARNSRDNRNAEAQNQNGHYSCKDPSVRASSLPLPRPGMLDWSKLILITCELSL